MSRRRQWFAALAVLVLIAAAVVGVVEHRSTPNATPKVGVVLGFDALDQSYSAVPADAAANAGVRLISMYLSNNPGKNATAAKVRAYHSAGIGVQLNWESTAGRALLGSAAGVADATAALAQARALWAQVGAPKNQPALIFSVDFDTNPTEYAVIDGYFTGAGSVLASAGIQVGVYGEAAVIEHLAAAGLSSVQWQTYAWSGARLSPQADLYQFSHGHTLGGASVDYDRIINASNLGAWWPAGSPLNVATTTTTPPTNGSTTTPTPHVAAPAVPATPSARTTYTVTARDSDGLAAAMRRIGISDWRRIAALNGIHGPKYPIRVGEILTLTGTVQRPQTRPLYTTARHGEGLYAIGARTGVSYQQLRRLNPSVRPSNLRLGQRIRLS